MTMMLGAALRPFLALALIWLVAAPIARLIRRYMPSCKLKDILFFSWRV